MTYLISTASISPINDLDNKENYKKTHTPIFLTEELL
jgi:hypothetical protein